MPVRGVDGTLNPALTWPRCDPWRGHFRWRLPLVDIECMGPIAYAMAKREAGKRGQQFRTIVFEHVEVVVAPLTRWTRDLRAFEG